MPTLQELMAQRAEIDAQIKAETDAKKAEGVAAVREVMKAYNLTLADLGAPTRARLVTSKRPVKYRDEQGNTWTGLGQRPRWLQKALAAGASLEQFAVKPQ